MQSGSVERLILQEFRHCVQNIDNMIIMPSARSIFLWQITFIPFSGPYSDLMVTFTVSFENFPSVTPKVVFSHNIHHPMVNSSSCIFDTSSQFGEWSVRERVMKLITFVYQAFIIVPSGTGAINHEAEYDIKKGDEYFRKKILDKYNTNPTISDDNELSRPSKWNNPKERMSKIMLANK